MSAHTWFLGTKASAPLAAALGVELTPVPELTFDDRWSQGVQVERWRAGVAAGRPVDSVVVAVWSDPLEPVPLVELGPDRWLATMETPLALWFASLAAAADRCGPGGQVVAVVDRPDPRESARWCGPAAVADAVEVMARSLAQAHGPRRVRVNVITNPARLGAGIVPPGGVAGPVGDEAAGGAWDDVVAAVAMLLSGRSAGVTANTIRIGGSR